MYRSFFTVILLAVMTANLAMAGGTPTPPPPPSTADVCANNYNNSASANRSCNDEAFTTVNTEDARVSASCEIQGGWYYNNTSITLDADQCGSLVNCNGTLKLDYC